MLTYEFYVAIGVIIVLIALPLVVMMVVRRLVPLEEPVEAFEPAEDTGEIGSLRDFWESSVPHLIELRDRLFKAFLGVIVGAAIGSLLVFSSPLGKPLPLLLKDQFVPPGVELQAIAPAESFVSYMRVALVVGIALAMPVIIYQIIAFFAPGLLPHEKRMVFVALPFVTELFLAGLAFGWFFTVPAAMEFLLTFGANPEEGIIVQPSLANFLSTVSMLLLWNGIIFELPAVIYLLARLGIVNTQMLARTRRYAVVVIVIAAALITPTGDPYNLLLLAIPMYLLYELGIILSRFVPQRQSEVGASA